jgi:hypothetical protein
MQVIRRLYDNIVNDFGATTPSGPRRVGPLPSCRVVRLDWPYPGA